MCKIVEKLYSQYKKLTLSIPNHMINILEIKDKGILFSCTEKGKFITSAYIKLDDLPFSPGGLIKIEPPCTVLEFLRTFMEDNEIILELNIRIIKLL